MAGRRGGIVVTGATGFLGRHLVSALRGDLPDTPILALGGPNSRSAPVDLADVGSIENALRGFSFDTVVHLAAQSSVAGAMNAPMEVWATNVVGTLNLMSVVGAIAPDALVINAGSAEVYGESFLSGVAVDETVALRPANAYARTKMVAEMAIRDVLPSAQVVLLRLFNQIGPGQDERFVASSFASQIAKIERGEGEGVVRVGDLSARRDFGHVQDAVAAIVRLIASSDELGALSVFNICSGVSRPVQDILDALLNLSTADVRVEVDESKLRPSAIPVAAGSYAALEAAVGWRPEVDFQTTMQQLLAYWRTNPDPHLAAPGVVSR